MTHAPNQDTSPLFSVVIATYNYGHLIERAIRSVLGQTFTDFQLIVVDDGSTDDTPARMAQYAGRLQYLRKPNGGQSSAYNLGADVATGRYIYILDADDELLPDTLRHFAEAIERAGPDAPPRLYFGGYISVSESGQEKARSGTDAPEDPRRRFRDFLRRRIVGLQNGAFITPRELFQTVRYPENLRNGTDIVFIAQALTRLPARQIHHLVLRSHEHPQRTRKQVQRNLAAGTAAVDTLFDPRIVPAQLMPLKRVFLAQRLRTMARLHYLGGDFDEAARGYVQALKAYPPTMFDAGSVKRMLIAAAKSRKGRGAGA